MSRLWMVNIEPGTSDEEIRDFLVKYGFPPYDHIEHEEGDGTRPAVMLGFNALDPTALTNLQERVNGMYWKKRKLGAQVMRDRFA